MTKKEIIEKYGEEAYQRQLERTKKYREQHREEINQYKKQYDQQHKEEINQYKKQYDQQHREKCNKYSKQYQIKHREKINEYHRQYQIKHREKINEYHRQYDRKYNKMFAYCISEQIEKIENYESAKKDNFNGWHIHHRLETHNSDGEKRLINISVAELKALDMYYNRPASELVFLTNSEHAKLHRTKQRCSKE